MPPPAARQFNLGDQKHGIEVIGVEIGGPADEAGIDEGDILVSLGDRSATSVDDLHKLLTQLPVGIPSSIVVLRGDRCIERMVVTEEYPSVAPQQ